MTPTFSLHRLEGVQLADRPVRLFTGVERLQYTIAGRWDGGGG
jgi:hypothetical protein